MPNTTNRVKLPYILQSQSQKEVTHNASLDLIDALLQAAMVSVGVNTPPGSPVAGDSYIVGTSPTGAWAGQAKALAFYTTGWNFITPWEGLTVWANDVNTLYTYDGSAWVLTVNPTSFQNLTMLGVNTSADATNKFAVASSAILFNHIGTDMQVKINKNAIGNKASFLFQTGFSGRAEFGLLKRGGKVYTAIIPNAKTDTLLPIIREVVTPDSIVYTDYFTSYNALDVSEFYHRRINHSKLFARGKNHINGIENFWNQAKRHMRKFNGIKKENFHWFLKECEWRFNGGNHNDLLTQLKYWYKITKH